MKRLIGLMLLIAQCSTGVAQRYALPDVDFDRRFDVAYMDSLRAIGHQHLQQAKTLPPTRHNDTLRLESLRFLSIVFKQLRGPLQDSSYVYAHQLVSLAQQKGNTLYAVRGLMLEEFHWRSVKNDYPKALAVNQQAAELCTSLRRESSPLWQVRMNMGDIYMLLKDYPQALKSYEESLTLLPYNKILSKRNQRLLISQAVGQIGEVYVALKRYDEALKQFEEVRQIAKETNSRLNIVYADERLGDFMLNSRRPEKAIPYYEEALEAWVRFNDLVGKASVWARLAECYSLVGHPLKAIEYGEKALAIAQLQKNPRLQQMASVALYKSYQVNKQPDKALAMFEAFVAVRDSINEQKQVDEILALQRKYEVEKILVEAEKRRLIHQQQLSEMRRQAEVTKIRTEVERRQLAAEAREAQLQQKIETERLRADGVRRQLAQQSRIDLLSSDIERQTLLRTFLLGGLFMLLVFVGMLIRNNRLIGRQRQEIQTLNVGLEDKVRERTTELETANEQLRTKNKEIEEALLRGQTLERKRVAADLHDNLGGTLSAIKLSLSALNPAKLSEREQQVYENLIQMTREAYAEVRYLSHNMQPDELEREGLARALTRLVEKLNQNQPIVFSLSSQDLPRLNKAAEFHLYSICLELSNNILKHSGATNAFIEFRRTNEELSMIIRDNGRGMESVIQGESLSDVKNAAGMGMRNIQTRIDAMQGRLEVYSEIGEGTTFFFLLPLSANFAVV